MRDSVPARSSRSKSCVAKLEPANGCWKPRDEVFVARLCNCSDLILDVKMCDVSSLACTAWHGRLNDLLWNFLAEIRDAEIHCNTDF